MRVLLTQKESEKITLTAELIDKPENPAKVYLFQNGENAEHKENTEYKKDEPFVQVTGSNRVYLHFGDIPRSENSLLSTNDIEVTSGMPDNSVRVFIWDGNSWWLGNYWSSLLHYLFRVTGFDPRANGHIAMAIKSKGYEVVYISMYGNSTDEEKVDGNCCQKVLINVKNFCIKTKELFIRQASFKNYFGRDSNYGGAFPGDYDDKNGNGIHANYVIEIVGFSDEEAKDMKKFAKEFKAEQTLSNKRWRLLGDLCQPDCISSSPSFNCKQISNYQNCSTVVYNILEKGNFRNYLPNDVRPFILFNCCSTRNNIRITSFARAITKAALFFGLFWAIIKFVDDIFLSNKIKTNQEAELSFFISVIRALALFLITFITGCLKHSIAGNQTGLSPMNLKELLVTAATSASQNQGCDSYPSYLMYMDEKSSSQTITADSLQYQKSLGTKLTQLIKDEKLSDKNAYIFIRSEQSLSYTYVKNGISQPVKQIMLKPNSPFNQLGSLVSQLDSRIEKINYYVLLTPEAIQIITSNTNYISEQTPKGKVRMIYTAETLKHVMVATSIEEKRSREEREDSKNSEIETSSSLLGEKQSKKAISSSSYSPRLTAPPSPRNQIHNPKLLLPFSSLSSFSSSASSNSTSTGS